MSGPLARISVLAAGLLLCLAALAGRAQAAGPVETRHLLVRDATGRLSEAELGALAGQAQATLERLLELWGLEEQERAQAGGFGKIQVIYDEALRGHCTSTCFVGGPGGGQTGGRDEGRRTRFVRVFGCAGAPHMLAHKLTSALMPQPDKLLRNMLGAISEERAGNPASFPACGQDVDDWVRSLGRSGTLIPLGQLGPDHGSWGMRDEGGGRLSAFDRPRQQRAYAEAASFARHLAATCGLEGLKRLARLSHMRQRPWREALGADLDELEARWLHSLRDGAPGREDKVGRLVRVMGAGSGPGLGDPCARARGLGE